MILRIQFVDLSASICWRLLSVTRTSGYFLSTVILLTLFGSAEVLAKEIYLQPKFGVKVEYDDNIRLLNGSSGIGAAEGLDKSAYGLIAEGGGRVGVRSDRYDLTLNNRFELKRYSSDFDLDSENIFIDLTSVFDITQRNKFSLRGDYTRDTTLTSELDVTGLVQDNIIREQWSLTPEWTYYLSNTQFLRANYTHNDITYEQSEISRFFDYTIDSVSLSYVQQWNSLLNTYLSASAMSFEVPSIRRDTTEYTVTIGMDYQFVPTWSTSMSIGRRFTNTETTFTRFNFNTLRFEDVTFEDDVQGMVFSFSLNKRFETGSVGLSYSRATSAQGNGQQRLVDRFAVNYGYKLTERLRISLAGGINVTTTAGSGSSNDDRTYYHVSPAVNWQLDRHASINAGYRYRMQEFENSDDAAVSNAFFIGFSYQWDKMKTQRY